jgi:ACS family allantoate permease-like MFS transporter
MLAFLIFTIFLLASLGYIHHYWNTKRNKQDALDLQSKFIDCALSINRRLIKMATDGVVHERVENEEFADLTDFQLRSFRYPV